MPLISRALRAASPGILVESRLSCQHEEPSSSGCGLPPAFRIIASECDNTAAYFAEFARRRGLDVSFLHLENIQFSSYLWDGSGDEIRDYPGIYWRASWSRDPDLNQTIAVLHDSLVFYPGVVINRPSDATLNASKPLQTAELARDVATIVRAVPTTITNRSLQHLDQCAALTIVKPMSAFRSEVVTLADQRLSSAGQLDCPVQMQPKLDGLNIRAHVCGQDVFGVLIKSDALDYRYADAVPMEEFRLPDHVVSWCVHAARRERLDFAGIDLLYEKATGKYFCFEINPAPGYHYYEERLVSSGSRPYISEWLLHRLTAR